MTDKELQYISKAYAVEHSYHKDVADDAEEFLRWLTKTHCIVSREKVISEIKAAQNELNEPSKPMLKFTLGYVLGLLHNLFGTELFEERSEK